jgi:cytosine/uracil/thiamine/allantoin permease
MWSIIDGLLLTLSAAFWWSYGFSVGVWSVGSSMVAMGLNTWQCKSYL